MIIMPDKFDSTNETPWICPSWIKTDCSLQLKFRLDKRKKTANLASWDSSYHDRAILTLYNKLKNLGFNVQTEVKQQYNFSRFTLAHWYDLIAIKDDLVLIIEVKPKDKWHNYKQYEYAQLLADQIYAKFVYFVYEYQTGRLIPKPKPNNNKIVADVEEKLQNIKIPIAQPSPECVFCPYSQCNKHPQTT